MKHGLRVPVLASPVPAAWPHRAARRLCQGCTVAECGPETSRNRTWVAVHFLYGFEKASPVDLCSGTENRCHFTRYDLPPGPCRRESRLRGTSRP